MLPENRFLRFLITLGIWVVILGIALYGALWAYANPTSPFATLYAIGLVALFLGARFFSYFKRFFSILGLFRPRSAQTVYKPQHTPAIPLTDRTLDDLITAIAQLGKQADRDELYARLKTFTLYAPANNASESTIAIRNVEFLALYTTPQHPRLGTAGRKLTLAQAFAQATQKKLAGVVLCSTTDARFDISHEDFSFL